MLFGARRKIDLSLKDFSCRRCGGCCRGEGYVWLTDDDIQRIARFLGLTPKDFVKRYCRRVEGTGDIALIDQDDAAMSCVFLNEDGCVVNDVKPVQCVGFPYVWARDDALEFCQGLLALEDDIPAPEGKESKCDD